MGYNRKGKTHTVKRFQAIFPQNNLSNKRIASISLFVIPLYMRIPSNMKRTAFVTPRVMEYMTEKELTQKIGYGRDKWHIIAVKELIDNSLDATEIKEGLIEIKVKVNDGSYSVEDNGGGLPLSTIKDSLNYAVTVTTNGAYVSPTRGQLGNALKCIWAIPFVETNDSGRCEVVTNGTKYLIEVRLDRIKEEPIINFLEIGKDDTVQSGTKITVFSSTVDDEISSQILSLVDNYALVNPHVRFSYEDKKRVKVYEPLREVKKIISSDPSPVHWFSLSRFQSYLLKTINESREKNKPITVREFIANFKGLKSTVRIKEISQKLGITSGETIEIFVKKGEPEIEKIEYFYFLLKEYEQTVKPDKLGFSGIERLNNMLGVEGKYKKVTGDVDGVPYAIEVGFWHHESFFEYFEKLVSIFAINYSCVLKNPYDYYFYEAMLDDAMVESFDPCFLYIHLIYPLVDFTETGKGRIELNYKIKNDLSEAVQKVTSEWQKIKKKTKRDERVTAKAYQDFEKSQAKTKMSLKDSCYNHMATAYRKASGSKGLPANARQIMYAIRPLVIADCGKFYSKTNTFTQGILNEFLSDNPELTRNWDVVYDARGHLTEPHTNTVINLGTIAVRNYINQFTEEKVNKTINKMKIEMNDIKTLGNVNRFKYALFIEKEGFESHFRNYRLSEKYDIAIMSTKGMSTTACRTLVDHLSQQGVTILVAHDFDKSGFTIFDTLAHDTDRYQYEVRPNVIDIGLSLDDAIEMNLEDEDVTYKQNEDPKISLRNSGATEEECNYLVRSSYVKGYSKGKPQKIWHGKRIELNSMTNDQFFQWLESKFEKYGVTKVIPNDKILANAYERISRRKAIQKEIDKVMLNTKAIKIDIPNDLTSKVNDLLKDDPFLSWDSAIESLIMED